VSAPKKGRGNLRIAKQAHEASRTSVQQALGDDQVDAENLDDTAPIAERYVTPASLHQSPRNKKRKLAAIDSIATAKPATTKTATASGRSARAADVAVYGIRASRVPHVSSCCSSLHSMSIFHTQIHQRYVM
jgi:hypothetical protein